MDVPSGSQLPDELIMLLDQLKLKGFDVRAHDELRIPLILVILIQQREIEGIPFSV